MNTVERVMFGNVLRQLREMTPAERDARAQDIAATVIEHFPADVAMMQELADALAAFLEDVPTV